MDSVQVRVNPPLGMYEVKLDDKGRLKLPVDFQQYFTAVRETQFFLTTLDNRVGRIYTVPAWLETQRFLAGSVGDPETKRNVAFIANAFGGQATTDGAGRLLVPAKLRTALGLENQVVRLFAYKEHIEVLSEQEYAANLQKAAQGITREKLGELETLGLL